MSYFLPKSQHLEALSRLTKIVADAKYEGNFLRRLFVLYQPDVTQAEKMANSLRFTKKQKEIFVRWAKTELEYRAFFNPHSSLNHIYRYGKQFCIDKILITYAIAPDEGTDINLLLKQINDTIVPIFPIRGKDIVNKGIASDYQIGRNLALLEQKWIDSDFLLTRNELLDMVENQ